MGEPEVAEVAEDAEVAEETMYNTGW